MFKLIPCEPDSIHDMLRHILKKVSGLDDMYKKVEEISKKKKKTNIETTMEAMDTELGEMENGMDFMETDIEGLKSQVKELCTKKADAKDVNKLKRNVVDLVNRSKRNNVILHGVPEGLEGDTHACVNYASSFFGTHLQAPDVEIERAHRTPMGRPKQQSERPCPIHVKLLRFGDREKLLRGSAALKDVRIRGKRVGISDDVHKETRS